LCIAWKSEPLARCVSGLMSVIYQWFTIFEASGSTTPPASHGLMVRKLQRHWPDHSQFLAGPQYNIGLTYWI
jgi:hypothetical protein